MKIRKELIEKSGYYLSAWGNENIIRNYVAYFENKIEEEVAEFRNSGIEIGSAHYPNFAAWLRFYTELICNSLYWKLFRYEGNWNLIIKKGFNELIENIMEKISRSADLLSYKIDEVEIKNMKDSINLILNLRHSFQHGGLPNLMRSLKPEIDQKRLLRMLNPNYFQETKKIFFTAEKFINTLQQPSIAFVAH